MSELTNILNVFACYYKNAQLTDDFYEVFTNIMSSYKNNVELSIGSVKHQETSSPDGSVKHQETNRQVKFLDINYEENLSIIEITDVDIEMLDDLYILIINNEPCKACTYIYPLLYYMSTIDWMKCEWTIVNKI